MKLWGKQVYEKCLGDQAILMATLDSDKRCLFVENILRMHVRLLASAKNLSSEGPVSFLLEHTWLVFACPVVSAKEKELFSQLIPIYEKILYECEYVSDQLHKSCLIHVCLIYDSDPKHWNSDMRTLCLKAVHQILNGFIGKPGYHKIIDFYYTVLFWVLQNSKEREAVLEPILEFLIGKLDDRIDMLSTEYRFYKFINICNQSIELSR